MAGVHGNLERRVSLTYGEMFKRGSRRGASTVTFRGVPREVREVVVKLVEDLAGLTKIKHKLPVVVVYGDHIVDQAGGAGFGCFCSKPLHILIAGLACKLMEFHVPKEMRCSHAEALHELRLTVAHEFVHYEQWRDGIVPHERGVTVRARRLLRDVAKLRAPIWG